MTGRLSRETLIVSGIAMVCGAAGLSWIITHADSLLWDFRTYYAAGKAFLAGLDPYSLQDLSLVVSEPLSFPFVYPPHTLWLYCLFAFPTYVTSSMIFLLLKVLAFGILLFVWKKHFLRDLATPLFVLFSLFAFNTSVFRDFETGNISVFEQVGLWLAFSFLLQRRVVGFAVTLMIFGSFKLTPLVFLFLPLLLDHPRKNLVVSGSIGFMALLAAGTFFFSPRLLEGFMRNAATPAGTGIVNPSIFQFFYDGRLYFERHSGVSLPAWAPVFLFLLSALVIIILAVRAVRSLRRTDVPEKELLLIFFLCIVYALLLPRFKDYSYILLIVPAWYVLHRSPLVRSPKLAAFLIMVPFHPPMTGLGIITPIWKYYPLAVTVCVFILFLRHVQSLCETDPPTEAVSRS